MGDEVHSLFGDPFRYGEGVYRLSDTGKEQVLRLIEPGGFLGELSLFSPSPMQHYAEALEPVTMCIIEAAPLKELLGKYPSIAFKVLEELSRRLERTEQLLEEDQPPFCGTAPGPGPLGSEQRGKGDRTGHEQKGSGVPDGDDQRNTEPQAVVL